MRFLGNLLWLVTCGFWQALGWFCIGCLWCITIVGIPVGVQCFKLAGFVLWPFGKDIVFTGGFGSVFVNILWMVFGGTELALGAILNGALLCVTIIGIPFGLQCFKFARLALMPVGSQVVDQRQYAW